LIPTFVIALREGVEASLIVGIIAAFLVKEGRRDTIRQMWLGVGVAVALCLGIAIFLRIVGEQLPQREQEGLETVIGVIAVAAVTYMIVWMRRHARGIKAELEGHAASALAAGSTMALVAMAFLAVLREGFETSVFLLAAFQDASDTTAAGAGAVIGLVAAVAIGLGIYRGGVRINLSRFFRVTGLILVFVAAGLLATSLHTAHEAGWFNGLQGQALDLSWLVQPGTISGSLLTGMLGLQPQPTVGEALIYLLYAVPMALYVLWPDRLRLRRAAQRSRVLLSALVLAVIGAALVLSFRRGIAGGVLVGVWVLRRSGTPVFPFMDCAAPGLLLAQAIGRWGNYFNQELFGRPTDRPWGLEIDPANRPAQYAGDETFHPLYLYESVWNLLGVVVLLLVMRTGRVRPPGIFCLYVAWYTLARTFLEFLRVDDAHELFGVRLNAYVSGALFVASVVCFWLSQRYGDDGEREPRRKERPVPKPARTMAVPKGRVRGRR